MEKRALFVILLCAASSSSQFAPYAMADIGCIFGGYSDYPDPIFLSFKGKIVLGGARYLKSSNDSEPLLRIFDPKSRTLAEPIESVAGLDGRLRVGVATRARVLVGGDQGAAFSRDLRYWERISPLKGKKVSSLAAEDEVVWVGGDGVIFKLVDQNVVERFEVGKGLVADLESGDGRVLFRLITESTPPQGYCSPYLIKSGFKSLDVANAKVTDVGPAGDDKEGKAITHMVLPTERPIAEVWAKASRAHPLPLSDFMNALEQYFSKEQTLRYFPFWNNVLGNLHSAGEFERLKRMFAASDDIRKKQSILVYAGRFGDAFSIDLLSFAIDRKDFMGEELARAVGRHEGPEFTKLLYRILREAASVAPPSSRNIPFPCPSGQAAYELLKRGEPAVGVAIAEVVSQKTTHPDVRKALEQHLRFSPEIRNATAVNARILLAGNSDSRREALPLNAVCRNQDPALHDGILASLDDPDPSVRSQAAACAGSMFIRSMAPKVIPKLKTMLQDEDGRVRAGALSGLRGFYWEDFSAFAIKAMKDPSADVRRAAVIYFQSNAAKMAVEPLIEALQDSDPGVREWATQALGVYSGDPRALEPIKGLLSDPNERVREAARNAIKWYENRAKRQK